jgi:hypothetical protein
MTSAESRRHVLIAVVGLLTVATLAGCSATSSYELSVSEAHSAVESARLAIGLAAEGRSTMAVASTAVSDAVDQVVGAESSLGETRSSDGDEASEQSTARELVHEATTALLAAERELEAGTATPDELTDLGDRLDTLDQALRHAS